MQAPTCLFGSFDLCALRNATAMKYSSQFKYLIEKTHTHTHREREREREREERRRREISR